MKETIQMGVRVDKDLFQQFKVEAVKRDKTIQDIINELIEGYIKEGQ